MNKLINISFLVFFYLSIHSQAQVDWEHPFLQIGKKDGLPATYIKDFAEDKHGFIWIATYAGISRFDGNQIYVLQDTLFPTEGFTDIEYDSLEDKLWIGTFIGLYSYDLLTDKVKQYPRQKDSREDMIHCLSLDERNDLWIGSKNRFAKLDRRQGSIMNIPVDIIGKELPEDSRNEIFDITQDLEEPEKLWLSTSSGIITYHTIKKEFEYVNDEIGNTGGLIADEIFISPYTQYVYFGMNNSANIVSEKDLYHYLVFDPKTQELISSITLDKEWSNQNILTFQDSLVLFSAAKGVAYFDERNLQITHTFYNTANEPLVYKADFIDSRRNIWAGMDNGIYMYKTLSNQGEMIYYQPLMPKWFHIPIGTFYDVPSNSVYMLIIGAEGLYQFDIATKSWKLYPYVDEEGDYIKSNSVGIFRLTDGSLKAVINRGLYEITNQGFVKKVDTHLHEAVYGNKAFCDSHDILWISKGTGVETLDFNTGITTSLDSSQVYFCKAYMGESFYYEDSHSDVWIAGFCEGFNRFDRSTGKFQAFELAPYTDGTAITSIDEKDGILWAQSSTGDLIFIDLNTPEKEVVQVVSFNAQIPKGEITLIGDKPFDPDYCISGTLDDAGRFWFLSRNGLYCYDHEASTLELFDESVGIAVNDPEMKVFASNGLIKLPDGRMLYSTRKGVGLYDPNLLGKEKELPIPYIQSISINHQKIRTDSGSFFKTSYHFKPYENFLGIDFSAIDFNNPSEVQYQYKLEGVDDTWKNPGKKNFLSYTQLRGGDYTFWLKAGSSRGIWSEELVRLKISIAKFWYDESWAKGFFIASIIFLIYSFYANRLKRGIEKKQLRIQYEKDLAELKMQALTAQMNPHFIFNSLNSIDFYIIKNDTKQASRYLNRFSRLMRLILKNSRSNYVTLRDDVEALELYLEIEALRFSHRFEYELTKSENIDADYLKIPPMLVQPYVENAIWHGLLHKKGSGKITIRYELDEKREQLQCIVMDNGIGRKKSVELKAQKVGKKERKSFGMNITKDKIEVIRFLHGIDASVDIIDLYDDDGQGMGTKVVLIIPV